MYESLLKVVTSYGMLSGFAIIGITMWVSYWISDKFTKGRLHGSAIAILLGLLLSYIGGAYTGGQKGLVDIPLFAGIGLLGGAMLRDFAIVATGFGVSVEELKRAGFAGVLALSVPGMLLTQRLGSFDQHAVLLGYKAFSILLGTALIAATWTVNARRAERDRLAPWDLAMLAAIGLVGGPITALFSVGVGELVALYLFIRHYPVLLCTGAACVISAISVIAGSVWHIEAGTIVWEVVLLAAPAAMLGGFLARPIAMWLGAKRLKTLDGGWIVLSALYLLWLNA